MTTHIPVVRSIDVGFGTTSVVTNVTADGNAVVRTFPSIAVPVDIGKPCELNSQRIVNEAHRGVSGFLQPHK